MSVAGETAGAEANDRAETKSVTVYRGRVNRRAGATFGVGENSAVFPIEVIRFIQPTRAGFLVDVILREHRRHPGSARKVAGVQHQYSRHPVPETHAPSQVAAFNLTIRAALPPRLRSVELSRTPNAPLASTTYLIDSHPSLTAAILKGAKTANAHSSGV
jgi:hypothetical protein